ncbi:MAG: hypothetical protein DRP45_06555 [Candidatus Zixiibacteriota bacterium]|nr:MAG: hypothetical protein DRP45_06555 [candidate division Zixibacteria bacterium]
MERHLQRLNWLQVRDLVPSDIDTILLPVGTVEAHGSACLGTDNFIPGSIAEGIADRLNALIAPTVSYGISRSLRRYNGGSTIKPETWQAFVSDILNSFAQTGFRNVIVLNGHGGNNSALKAAAYEFHAKMQKNIAVIHWWDLCGNLTREFYGHMGGHGGTDESAMVQTVNPTFVNEEQHDPEFAYYFRSGADVYPVPGTILLYKEGEGYPDFDIEKSRKYHARVIKEVGDFVEHVIARWRKFGM